MATLKEIHMAVVTFGGTAALYQPLVYQGNGDLTVTTNRTLQGCQTRRSHRAVVESPHPWLFEPHV